MNEKMKDLGRKEGKKTGREEEIEEKRKRRGVERDKGMEIGRDYSPIVLKCHFYNLNLLKLEFCLF